MLKRSYFAGRAVATGLALVLACTATATADIYGEGIRLDEVTAIVDILADPDAFIGKTVRVEGRVLDICPRRGCWIEMGSENANIRIKVEDDIIVFPAAAKGRIANAEGVVEAIEMTRQDYVSWLTHVAEEKGEEFDADKANLGEGPFRLIRIRGAGARIE